MFRTRDFILLFTVIVFLMTAIGATLLLQVTGGSKASGSGFATLASTSPEAYPAVVVAEGGLDRAQRVASMRAKIAEQPVLTEDFPLVEEESEEELPEEPDDVATTTESTVVACAYTTKYAGFWDARGLSWVTSEGARLLVRGEISPTSIPESVLQLPMLSLASNNPSCVGSDVVGIANDGSLIRNDEVELYSIFGSETLIGYALDGFPIYGASQVSGDACGGRVVAGQYRYELQSDSETVLNCFAATPVTLP